MPVGVGKLVYFYNPTRSEDLKLPGLVMSSQQNSTVIFILGPSNIVTTDYLISLSSTKESKSTSSEFIINIDLSKFFSQTLDVFGNSLGGVKTHFLNLPRPLNGISDRLNVWKPLITGIKVIDGLFPIGLGQRQLIIGDRYTGKTTIAVDTVIAQKKTKLKCIYVSIGQKKSSVKKLVSTFKKHEVFYFSTIISADSSDSAALQFLAPYTGCSLGEVFSVLGGDSLVVYDDLSKHSVAYRQMALLLRKSPGRDAFPSDIFYLHSNLLERAGQFFSGSLTALPIVETLARDVSAYIPTNIISITDGQIFLDSTYFNKGILPAVHVGLSVSRVGSKSQFPCMAYMASWFKSSIIEFRDLEILLNFASDVDLVTGLKLKFGTRLSEFLCQKANAPVCFFDTILLFALVFKGALQHVTAPQVFQFGDFVVRWTGEFLYRRVVTLYGRYDLIEYKSFDQIWNFNFSQKTFMNTKNFINFYSYILIIFKKFIAAKKAKKVGV